MTQPFTEEYLQQYLALTTGVGLVDAGKRTLIEVTGEDRMALLHNLCTQNVRDLQPGQGCEAFFCTAGGKILGHVFIFCEVEAAVLDTVVRQSQILMTHLDKYIISEDVELADRTTDWCQLWVAGPQANRLIGDLQPPDTYLSHTTGRLAGQAVVVRRTNVLGEPTYAVQCGLAARQPLWEHFQAAGALPCEQAVVEAVRIEAGFPLMGQEISEKCLPQEIGRESQAVSFTKGCYLGQETVARIDALGHVNWHLVRMQFSSAAELQPGDEVFGGDKALGNVTSVAWSPAGGGPLAFARARQEVSGGHRVRVAGHEGVVI